VLGGGGSSGCESFGGTYARNLRRGGGAVLAAGGSSAVESSGAEKIFKFGGGVSTLVFEVVDDPSGGEKIRNPRHCVVADSGEEDLLEMGGVACFTDDLFIGGAKSRRLGGGVSLSGGELGSSSIVRPNSDAPTYHIFIKIL